MATVIDILGVLALVLLVLGVWFLIRVRRLAGRVGAFECALRQGSSLKWRSGIAVFGDSAVEWNPLVSLTVRPRYRFTREGLELRDAAHRGKDGRVVDVDCSFQGRDLQLAMLEDSHSALISWLEAAAPRQPRLF